MIQIACVYCDDINTDFSLVTVKVAQSCPTFRNPMSYAVHGILQACSFTE